MIELNAEARIKKRSFYPHSIICEVSQKKIKRKKKKIPKFIKTLFGENLPRHKCNTGCHGHYLGEPTQ